MFARVAFGKKKYWALLHLWNSRQHQSETRLLFEHLGFHGFENSPSLLSSHLLQFITLQLQSQSRPTWHCSLLLNSRIFRFLQGVPDSMLANPYGYY